MATDLMSTEYPTAFGKKETRYFLGRSSEDPEEIEDVKALGFKLTNPRPLVNE